MCNYYKLRLVLIESLLCERHGLKQLFHLEIKCKSSSARSGWQ